ncbi:hypothetical protein [Paenibacillus glycanilyticus]|uniref:Uncharacterized protein n=1 Tax=Paenibacillus glycanilyticus TaxID=126569 RepID=A0ABQ6G9J3_9BACL|nr:hypothetical protein [Paenibacillus glycanilyticus]GLX65737.1 hypothetical protein MU1_00810 [Paenibacillus glycanilyticus]
MNAKPHLHHQRLNTAHNKHNERVAEFHKRHAAQIANGENGNSVLARWERFVYNKTLQFAKKMSEKF